MSNHTLIMYRNDATRQFSLTARDAKNVHLDAMAEQEANRGFVTITIATGLTKADANNAKVVQTNVLEQCGYECVTRVPVAQ